jgi:hypothetical protein
METKPVALLIVGVKVGLVPREEPTASIAIVHPRDFSQHLPEWSEVYDIIFPDNDTWDIFWQTFKAVL